MKRTSKIILRVITIMLALVMFAPAIAHADWLTDLENLGEPYNLNNFNAGAYDAPSYGRLSGLRPVEIGMGYLGGMFLDQSGQIYNWGWNGQGQLGLGIADDYVLTPGTDQSYIDRTPVVLNGRPYSGGYTAVDFFTNPENYGASASGQGLNAPTKIVDIGVGYHHRVALDEQGRVWAWGYNIHNQVGQTEISRKLYPRLVGGLPNNVTKVFANSGELNGGLSIALTADGKVWTWGANYFGQHGAGTLTATPAYQSTPHMANIPDGIRIVDVAAGMYHVVALDQNGDIWMWGRSDYGAMAMGMYENRYYPTPFKLRKPAGMGRITNISTAYSGSLALDESHNVWQWGTVYQGGPSGRYNGWADFIHTPRKVEAPQSEVSRLGYTPIAQNVFAGESVSYFVDQYGRPWAWGDNRYFGFGREGGYETNNNIISSKPLQFPQVIGDGDTQIYDSQPKNPQFSQYELRLRLGNHGFNWLHPTIYDEKYENSAADRNWIELALKPIPAVQQIIASRSNYILLDRDGNIFKWGYDGSGTVAWGDDFDKQYDITGNARDGLYDAYCYEVMFERAGAIAANRSFSVDKTVTSVPADGVAYKRGEVLTYKVTITNTGNQTLTVDMLEDTLVSVNLSDLDKTVLAYDDNPATPADERVATLEYQYVITAEDVEAGRVENTVTAGVANDEPGKTESDTEIVTNLRKAIPEYSVEKTVLTPNPMPAGGVVIGDTVTYQVVVTNLGEDPIKITNVVDTLVSGVKFDVTDIAPGAATSTTYSYVVTEKDAINGQISNGVQVYVEGKDDPETDEVVVEVEAPRVLYTVKKDVLSNVPATGVKVGEMVVYRVTVQNTGNVPIKITDVQDSLVPGVTFANPNLAPGQSTNTMYFYYATQADAVRGEIVNTVKVFANNDTDNPVIDDAIVDVEDAKPLYRVEKEVISDVPPTGVKVGSLVVYQVTVTNEGSVAFTITDVQDSLVEDVTFNNPSLAPGQSTTVTYMYTVKPEDAVAGEIRNNVKVYANGDTDNPMEDEEVVDVEDAGPQYTVVKDVISDVPPTGVKVGSLVVYHVTLTNTGSVPFTVTQVIDSLVPDVKFGKQTLTPGEETTATYLYYVTDADALVGEIRNNIKVFVDNDTDNPEGDDEIVIVERVKPQYTVDKSVISRLTYPETAVIGETIEYRVVVTNTGTTPFTITNAPDTLVGAAVFEQPTVQPGQSTEATYTYVAKMEDAVDGKITNEVSVYVTNNGDDFESDFVELWVAEGGLG